MTSPFINLWLRSPLGKRPASSSNQTLSTKKTWNFDEWTAATHENLFINSRCPLNRCSWVAAVHSLSKLPREPSGRFWIADFLSKSMESTIARAGCQSQGLKSMLPIARVRSEIRKSADFLSKLPRSRRFFKLSPWKFVKNSPETVNLDIWFLRRLHRIFS